jgi:hypothetical protein
MTYEVGNPGPDLGQTHTYGEDKSINRIPTRPSWLLRLLVSRRMLHSKHKNKKALSHTTDRLLNYIEYTKHVFFTILYHV